MVLEDERGDAGGVRDVMRDASGSTATALVATECTETVRVLVDLRYVAEGSTLSFGVELFVEGMVQLEDEFERHRVAKLHRPLARATSTNPSAREDRDEHQSPRRPSTLCEHSELSCLDCARVVVTGAMLTLPRRGKGHAMQLGSTMN